MVLIDNWLDIDVCVEVTNPVILCILRDTHVETDGPKLSMIV